VDVGTEHSHYQSGNLGFANRSSRDDSNSTRAPILSYLEEVLGPWTGEKGYRWISASALLCLACTISSSILP